MPDRKISELTELISAHPINDVIPVVDTSVDETKKITLANLPMTESAIDFSYPYTIDFDAGVSQTRNLTGTSPTGKFLNPGGVSGGFGPPNSSTVDSVYIGSNVKIIGDHTFQGFDNLTSVTISDGVELIEDFAFALSENLTSIAIPDSVTGVGFGVFEACTSLTGATISNNLSFMNSSMFGGCTGLTSVTIPDSVTGIDNSVFQSCISLTGITIPNSVTSIGAGTFASCSGLTSITIGSGVTEIGMRAFKDCSGLSTINLLAPTAPKTFDFLGNEVDPDTAAAPFFSVAPDATINVPVGADYPATFGGLPVSFNLTT